MDEIFFSNDLISTPNTPKIEVFPYIEANMYLTSMNLSGFKSFVDPTRIKFQSNLTAIVGPNGCGKSNVVDAVRWVIGESSAKNLRAESMSDVIFNGTNKRKPVGQASIELVFDNSDGSLGGEYATYNEISIRRVLTRDGTSTYFLNNTRCRRKDIVNIFLGTGLGPRSYAIIEQGMISKLIEAKPDELRVYLEEAAGISKYKERRRETENRIKHTRENLERLADLREELEKQLARLKRQASAAERYKVLREEQRVQKAQLSTITWRELQVRSGVLEKAIKEQTLLIDQKVAMMHELDARIETQRDIHVEQTETVNDIQKTFYSVANEITKLEQQINHANERQHQLEADIEQTFVARKGLSDQLVADQQQLNDVQSDISNLENTSANFNEDAQAAHMQLHAANENMQEWQERWDAFLQTSAATVRQVDINQAQLANLHQRESRLNEQLSRKTQQNDEFDFENLEEQISTDQDELSEIDDKNNALQDIIRALDERMKSTRERYHAVQTQLNEANSDLQRRQGRLSSLEVLQQAALHKNDDAQRQWLEQHGLSTNVRLAEVITVEAGWETAVETVLATHLQAICVEDFTILTSALSEIKQSSMSFIKKRRASDEAPHRETILSKVQSDYDMSGLLHGIYLAPTLQDALEMVKSFDAYESVVTQEGIWLSKHWLRFDNAQHDETGVLKRQHEIDELNLALDQVQSSIHELSKACDQSRETLLELEEQRDEQQFSAREINKHLSEVKSRLSGQRTKLEQLTQRRHQVLTEIEELTEQLTDVREQIHETESELRNAEEQAQEELTLKDLFQNEKHLLKTQLEAAKQTSEVKKQKADEMQVRLQSCRSQVQYLNQGIDRAQQQLNQLESRGAKMAEQLEQITSQVPQWSEQLEGHLTDHLEIETGLTEAKQRLNHLEAELRQNEKQRAEYDDEQQEIREQLDVNRMDNQTIKVKIETLDEQIAESGFDRETILQNLPEDVDPEQLASGIEDCETKIARLGPINLAAIEECEEISERKIYLDKQNDDLTEALTTLENAIRKIDKETKAKFKETFDNANKLFSEYFPKIFGGGNASLELIGDELLDAGVLVRAQPPGKRNSTIHLLSGGEKALTAIALVFSLFQLNPAPFCILDEVDAPLDDANVLRYANLVSAMSEKIQFIYISHNKIAIEMAKQLCGVTMQEAGVSRLVSVDIDEAVKMVEAE